jgi:hypothetical protein
VECARTENAGSCLWWGMRVMEDPNQQARSLEGVSWWFVSTHTTGGWRCMHAQLGPDPASQISRGGRGAEKGRQAGRQAHIRRAG